MICFHNFLLKGWLSNLSTQSLKNLLKLTPMTSSYISFLFKYISEQIAADDLSVRTAFCTNTISQTSVNELHLKIHSLSLPSKVKDTSLSPLAHISRERAQIGSRQALTSQPTSHTFSSAPFSPGSWFCLHWAPVPLHPPELDSSLGNSGGFFCKIN